MDIHENLVIGRLGFIPREEHDTTACSAVGFANTYGASRLGLKISKISSDVKACPGPNRTGNTSQPRRGTYRMPAELLTRLKNYAKIVHRYQYIIVTDAVSEYLDRPSERRDVGELRRAWWKVISAIRHSF